jgi:hypothetical protein
MRRLLSFSLAEVRSRFSRYAIQRSPYSFTVSPRSIGTSSPARMRRATIVPTRRARSPSSGAIAPGRSIHSRSPD